MPFTRAQATALLNKSEMRLFDDSRANALRGFDRTALAGRIERTREARDRARDLLKRQRLAARTRSAARDDVAVRTARKEALLVELLERFTEARRQAPAQPAARKATARKAAKEASGGSVSGKAAGRTVAKKGAGATSARSKEAAGTTSAASKKAAKSPAKKAAVGSTSGERAVAKKNPVRPAGSTAGAPTKAGTRGGATRRSAGSLTPGQALENTRQLLEEKQAQAREPKPWHSIEPGSGQVSQAGYQSGQAAAKAQDLHAGEARMASTHGSSSTRDRRSQGQRDHRSDTE